MMRGLHTMPMVLWSSRHHLQFSTIASSAVSCPRLMFFTQNSKWLHRLGYLRMRHLHGAYDLKESHKFVRSLRWAYGKPNRSFCPEYAPLKQLGTLLAMAMIARTFQLSRYSNRYADSVRTFDPLDGAISSIHVMSILVPSSRCVPHGVRLVLSTVLWRVEGERFQSTLVLTRSSARSLAIYPVQ